MRIGRLVALALLGTLLGGCYTLRAGSGQAPAPGEVVAFDVNDQGRVELGGAIGPEVGQIEGRLVAIEADEYVLAVRAVRFLRGGEQIWNRERVAIKKTHVGAMYERRFSRGRSVALGAAAVGGFAALMVTRDLLGLGQGDRDPTDPKPTPTELIRP